MADATEARTGFRSITVALLALFGVLTPVLATLVEAGTGMCADAFFDPLPTPIHLAATLMPPALVLWGLRTSRWADRAPSRVIALLWGAALGIALWYAVLFTPLVPLSLIGILMMGLGFLPLAPLTVLAAVIAVRPAPEQRRGWIAGVVAGLALLCAADLPAATSQVLLSRATSEDPARAAAALDTLRTVVPDDAILDAARRPVSTASPLGALAHFGWEYDGIATRIAAWRATGRVAQPWTGGFFGFDNGSRWTEWDEQGGDVVGMSVEDLCLASSLLTATVDPRAALADLSWEMTFRNDREWGDAEARTVVRLPPGAVVSDATLWVAGTPRPAVFSTTQSVRRAYQDVVQVDRRDPLLVTSGGPDEVFVQCFPVPADGGTIRIALRIAAPVAAGDGGPGTLTLPYFAERNFAYCGGATHVVTIDGERREADADDELDDEHVIAVPGTPETGPVWGPDPFDVASVIVADTELVTPSRPSSLALVVDASTSTEDARELVDETLDAIPDRMPVAVIVASDEVVDATGGVVAWGADARAAVDAAMAGVPWRGGIDATPALVHAAALVRDLPGAEILWLHGRQEMRIGDDEDRWMRDWGELRGAAGWEPLAVPVHALRIADGDNRVVRLAREDGSLTEVGGRDPAGFVASWLATEPREERVARRLSMADRPLDAVETTEPRALAALHAAAHVAGLRASDPQAAVAYARQYRVVTPVTGAVVLETDQDYVNAGLVDESAPVPEPGTWALLAVVALALFIAWRRGMRSAVA